MCGWRRHSALRDSFARHQIIRCDAALTEQARSPMRAMAAATTCRVTALLITQSFDSALLWAAQARLSMCAMAAATARRVTVLLVTQAIDNALLWAAQARLSTCSTTAATTRRVTALLTTQSFDSALLWGSAGTLVNMCNGGGNSAPRDSFARHSSDRQRAALGSAARLSTCATAAATARRVTALLITQTFDSALLSAAQARSSVREMAAALARRVAALLVTHSFRSVLLWPAQRRHARQCVRWRRQQHGS